MEESSTSKEIEALQFRLQEFVGSASSNNSSGSTEERNDVCERLLEILSDPSHMRNFSASGISRNQLRHERSCMWKSLINTAIQYARCFEFYLSDVQFLMELLKLCYAHDPILDEDTALLPVLSTTYASIAQVQHVDGSPTSAESHGNIDIDQCQASVIHNKLGRDQSRLLYRFCVAAFRKIKREQSEQDESLELAVLSLLLFIVGRVELVC